MDFSYKEKGLIASLGVTLLVFGWYFYGSFTNLKLNPEPPGIVEIINLIVWINVLESIIQAFVSFKNKSQLADERDKLIGKISYRYRVQIPNTKDLFAMTPMPWEGGRSWIRSIEKGISGLGYYLLSNSPVSRSGQGVQASHKLRKAVYRPTKYMSSIINAYSKYLQTGKKSKLKK